MRRNTAGDLENDPGRQARIAKGGGGRNKGRAKPHATEERVDKFQSWELILETSIVITVSLRQIAFIISR